MRYQTLFPTLDPPLADCDRALLGDDFAAELDLVSRLWFACGYRPGIGAYLNFFLLRDFITLHDRVFPARFRSFGAMARSFYRTDLFIRDVTDSGTEPSGGISSPKVRALLAAIMARHRRIAIPDWMMTYFGFSLLENVEQQCAPLDDSQRQLHLAYMAKTYRLMGLRFSARREAMEELARDIERAHAGAAPQLERRAHHILLLGEMVGVTSRTDSVAAMLPAATRAVFGGIARRVQPGLLARTAAQLLGKRVMKRAIGAPRRAVPVWEQNPAPS